jgi:hypothetical protein
MQGYISWHDFFSNRTVSTVHLSVFSSSKDAMLREYQSEIQKLKQLLEQSGGASIGDFGRQQLNDILSL